MLPRLCTEASRSRARGSHPISFPASKRLLIYVCRAGRPTGHFVLIGHDVRSGRNSGITIWRSKKTGMGST
jgi:hypothetical protein